MVEALVRCRLDWGKSKGDRRTDVAERAGVNLDKAAVISVWACGFGSQLFGFLGDRRRRREDVQHIGCGAVREERSESTASPKPKPYAASVVLMDLRSCLYMRFHK